MIVNVRRLERNKTWGVRDPKSGKYRDKYENCNDKFVPALDHITGMLRTGLSKELEKKFEEDLALEEKTLAASNSYWDTFSIIIPEEGLVLNTQNPMDNLKYHVLKADPEVATSPEEASINPKAQYIMYTDEAAAKNKNNKRDIIANAYAKFATLTQAEVVDALYMFGKDADYTDMEICKNTLGELLEKDPEKFLDVMGDDKFKDKVWIIKTIRAGIIRKGVIGTGFNMPLYFGDIYLGKGLDEAINFLLDKENQNVFIGLKKAYEAYKKEKS